MKQKTQTRRLPRRAPRALARARKASRARRERGLSGVKAGPGLARLGQFLRDVRAEMRRVSWPTLNEVKNTTIITLVAVIFFAVYLFLVDPFGRF